MKRGNGLITKEDLPAYRARERKPIHGTYHGYDIYGPPPPSSGGTCLVLMLNVLENFDLKKHDPYAPQTLPLITQKKKPADREPAKFLGAAHVTKGPAPLPAQEAAQKRQDRSHRSQ